MVATGRIEINREIVPTTPATQSLFVNQLDFQLRTTAFPGNLNAGSWNCSTDYNGNVWAMHTTQGLYKWNEADPTTNRAEYPTITGINLKCVGDWIVYTSGKNVIKRPLANPAASSTVLYTASSGTVNTNIGGSLTNGNTPGCVFIFQTTGSSIFNTFSTVLQVDPITDIVIANGPWQGDEQENISIVTSEASSYKGSRVIIRLRDDNITEYYLMGTDVGNLIGPISPDPPDSISSSYFIENGIWQYWGGGSQDLKLHNFHTGTVTSVARPSEDADDSWNLINIGYHIPNNNPTVMIAVDSNAGVEEEVMYREVNLAAKYPRIGTASHSTAMEKFFTQAVGSLSTQHSVWRSPNYLWCLPNDNLTNYGVRITPLPPVDPPIPVTYMPSAGNFVAEGGYPYAKKVVTMHDERTAVFVTTVDQLVTADLRELPNLTFQGITSNGTTLDNPSGLAIINGYAVVSSSTATDRISVFDISSPANIVAKSSLSTSNPVNIKLLRNNLGIHYVGSGNRFQVVNVGPTGTIAVEALLPISPTAQGADFFDTYGGQYVIAKSINGNTVTIFEYNEAGTWTQIASRTGYTGQWTGNGEVRVFGDYAYVVNDGAGVNGSTLTILGLNFSGFTIPQIGIVNIPRITVAGNGRPNDVAVIGDRAYVVSSINNEIWTVNIANKANPFVIGGESFGTKNIGATGSATNYSHIIPVGGKYLLTTSPTHHTVNIWTPPLVDD